jgi:hypothetical protein
MRQLGFQTMSNTKSSLGGSLLVHAEAERRLRVTASFRLGCRGGQRAHPAFAV